MQSSIKYCYFQTCFQRPTQMPNIKVQCFFCRQHFTFRKFSSNFFDFIIWFYFLAMILEIELLFQSEIVGFIQFNMIVSYLNDLFFSFFLSVHFVASDDIELFSKCFFAAVINEDCLLWCNVRVSFEEYKASDFNRIQSFGSKPVNPLDSLLKISLCCCFLPVSIIPCSHIWPKREKEKKCSVWQQFGCYFYLQPPPPKKNSIFNIFESAINIWLY